MRRDTTGNGTGEGDISMGMTYATTDYKSIYDGGSDGYTYTPGEYKIPEYKSMYEDQGRK